LPHSLRLGIFGGTFNPIHACHLQVAARVRDLVRLDRVVFVPAAHPPHKPTEDLAPAHHRLEMTRLAIAGWPGFEVDDLELRRAGPSYSIDTVEAFRRRAPTSDLYFLLGIDMFAELATWRQPERLVAESRLVVMARTERPFVTLAGGPWIGATSLDVLARFDAVPGEAALDLSPSARVILVKVLPCRASSTQIRLDLTAGRSVKKVLPGSVHSYILKQQLYGARDASA
jgi:nicotinate-nucleotide adenylyltransferase